MPAPPPASLPLLQGLPPVAAKRARVLVLGSLPGAASLQAAQYYAHPRNLFWRFMGELVGAGPEWPYPERLRRLGAAGIALWDVFACARRAGSLDAAIRAEDARGNDLRGFLAAHPGVGTLLFNGAKAADAFARLHAPSLAERPLRCRRLPSTSPANAAMPPAAKLAAWRQALQEAGIDC